MQDISLHIMDIMQNSVRAKASLIQLELCCDRENDLLVVTITDNGVGMEKELAQKASSPFVTSRTSRRVGLGIPFFKQSGEISGGGFSLWSQQGKGTSVKVSYGIAHINRIPLGDLGETITAMLIAYPEIRYGLALRGGNKEFSFDSEDITSGFGQVQASEWNVIAWIKAYINEGVSAAFLGILPEIGQSCYPSV